MPRVRIGRNKQSVSISDKRKMTQLSDDINRLQHEMELISKEVKEKSSELSELMTNGNVAKHEGLTSIAEMVVSPGRSSRTVRVKDYRDKVSEEEFMDSVSVTITAAKQNLTEKEMDEVCDTTPAKPGKPVLKVRDK